MDLCISRLRRIANETDGIGQISPTIGRPFGKTNTPTILRHYSITKVRFFRGIAVILSASNSTLHTDNGTFVGTFYIHLHLICLISATSFSYSSSSIVASPISGHIVSKAFLLDFYWKNNGGLSWLLPGHVSLPAQDFPRSSSNSFDRHSAFPWRRYNYQPSIHRSPLPGDEQGFGCSERSPQVRRIFNYEPRQSWRIQICGCEEAAHLG